MLITKLYYGFGILLLSIFPTRNLDYKIANNPFTHPESKKISVVGKKLQESGKEIYTDFCIQCHGANGKGDGAKFPPLAGSDWLTKKRKQSIHAVKFGQNGEIVVNNVKFNNTMPTMGLSNQEVADVMNYVMTSWGNKQKKKVTEKEVEAVLY
jgi:mono/diheme cytochrome c family protein